MCSRYRKYPIKDKTIINNTYHLFNSRINIQFNIVHVYKTCKNQYAKSTSPLVNKPIGIFLSHMYLYSMSHDKKTCMELDNKKIYALCIFHRILSY